MSLPPDRPALGAYALTQEERAARSEWIRWVLAEHTRAWHARRLVETEFARLVGDRGGVDPADAARRLRALADQLAS